ncbi:DUF6612 family protein [Alteribacillus bidgolensis]|uniref:Uncharacterized protein n=1 Tax=Alteribacillus bidgolensis TaxID=930129 RepID=A0A1G8M6D5_9BACI|nr:DUF6612 family protein [Alteribacillus bidgolensis]SDI63498.1 hypothetical protein SAMN05216352_109231 [Alteribacillus bidgolensis]
MRGTKAAAAAVSAGLLLLSACGEQQLPEEVYKQSIEAMEELDSVYFTHSNTLSAEQEGVSNFTRGAVQYNDPLEAYIETNMNLIDLEEPVELDVRINGSETEIRENEEWEDHSTEAPELESMISPVEDMNFFLEFEEEFLMKEVDDYYEVSFKGTEERHKSLVEKKLNALGISESAGGLSEEERESIQLERIDMIAYIDKENKLLLGYDSRFSFTIEIAGELRAFNEISYVRYDEYNEVNGNLENFLEEKVKEIERQKMEAEQEEEEASENNN